MQGDTELTADHVRVVLAMWLQVPHAVAGAGWSYHRDVTKEWFVIRYGSQDILSYDFSSFGGKPHDLCQHLFYGAGKSKAISEDEVPDGIERRRWREMLRMYMELCKAKTS